MNDNDDDDKSDPAELPITWGLFVKLQMAPEGELEDVWDYNTAAEAEIGVDGLMRGWDLVACVLLKYLRDHAAKLGCDCGSDEWLQREQVYNAQWAEQRPDDPFEGQSDD
jgi:hypothetical protein